MPRLRKLLTERYDWYEACLQQLAELDGYGNLSKPVVEFLAHIGRDPVKLVDLARQLGVSRQWARRLANEAAEIGLVELATDPSDKRAMIVSFSKNGWRVVRLAAARMREIDTELENRIGTENFEMLIDILSQDWGPANMPQTETTDTTLPVARDQRRRGSATGT